MSTRVDLVEGFGLVDMLSKGGMLGELEEPPRKGNWLEKLVGNELGGNTGLL